MYCKYYVTIDFCNFISLSIDLKGECTAVCSNEPTDEGNEDGHELSDGKLGKTTNLASLLVSWLGLVSCLCC